MTETTYTIENAKSGRSACKKCKTKIGKGDLRIGVTVDDGQKRMTSWYIPECFNMPRKFVKEGLDAEQFVESVLMDNSDEQVLRENADEIIKQIKSKKNSKSASDAKVENSGKSSSNNPINQIKINLDKIRKAADMNDDQEDDEEKLRAKKKTKVKSESSLSERDKSYAQAYEAYESFKNDELKDVLRWNKQMVSGAKNALLQRIVDGHVNGRLGMCPICGKGRLKLNDDNWEDVYCNGYFDEDTMVRVPCFYKGPTKDAPRFQPWYTRKPTEEEEEEINASTGRTGKKSKKESSSNDNSPLSKLQTRASALENEGKWDLTSPVGLKKAAKLMVTLCTDKSEQRLDLPSSESKAVMEVGKLILQNKSSSASEFVAILVDKFGFLQDNAIENKAKTEAVTASCKNSANGPVLAAILELGELYFKEKNTNAGVTYKKVAEAIKNLKFEITSDNAKGLGKGKTKVAGIGKSSADKIYEFVTTGTMAKLEEKRASS